MKEAIALIKQEVAWHKSHYSKGPSIEYEVAFIAGLEHVLELLLRANEVESDESITKALTGQAG